MRLWIVALAWSVVCLSGSATMWAEEEKDLAAEAMKQVSKEWKVEFTVQSTGQTRTKTRVFLNSEKDFRSERNLTVMLDMKALAEDLKKAKITEPRKHFAGKKIRVKGKVSLYNKWPQIVVEKLEQLEVLK
jgi:hypothetical protein